jgi:hypothetical protein
LTPHAELRRRQSDLGLLLVTIIGPGVFAAIIAIAVRSLFPALPSIAHVITK